MSPRPNLSLPEVATLVAAMVQARDAVESRSWSHPQEPTTENWWADVLADPRARTPRRRGSDVTVERTFYRLADEPREVILVACNKCEWKAAFQRAELIAAHGATSRCRACLNVSPHRDAPDAAIRRRSSPLGATIHNRKQPVDKPLSLLGLQELVQ
jgi:hypothetical protein